ncbi:MAG: NAD(P)-dependent alcohol dehydrogenase [Pseudomonadota bacterium]
MKGLMKAVVTDKYGTAEVLKYQEAEIPVVKEDEILVQVHASSVNPVDWKIRKGMMKFITGIKPPKILGGDYSGIVVETGNNIKGYNKGDAVWGSVNSMKGGAYAKFLKAKNNEIGLKPQNLDFLEAASIPVVGLTAYQSLVYKGGLKAGDHIIINGCSGGVGFAGLQIAKAFNCRVTGVCSTKNIELVKKMGADEVIDYRKEDVFKNKGIYDIFFDTVGNISFSQAKAALKPKGSYVTPVPGFKIMLSWLIANLTGFKKIKIVFAKLNAMDLNKLKELAENNKLHPVIEKVYSLDQIREAHIRSETGRVAGKLVLKIT